jgi:hypothetical protein
MSHEQRHLHTWSQIHGHRLKISTSTIPRKEYVRIPSTSFPKFIIAYDLRKYAHQWIRLL